MRKAGLFLVFALLSTNILFGQYSKINLGVEGGPSAVLLWGNDALNESFSLRQSFSAGVSFQYNFNRIFALRTNVAFERKGNSTTVLARDEQGNFLGEFSLLNNLDYLTIPLLARASFGNKVKFFVNGGPFIGFLLKQTYVHEAFNEFPEAKYDGTDTYNSKDFGATFGLGFTINLTKSILLSLEGRNNLGLYNISKLSVIGDGKVLTNSAQLLFGVSYQFGGTFE